MAPTTIIAIQMRTGLKHVPIRHRFVTLHPTVPVMDMAVAPIIRVPTPISVLATRDTRVPIVQWLPNVLHHRRGHRAPVPCARARILMDTIMRQCVNVHTTTISGTRIALAPLSGV